MKISKIIFILILASITFNACKSSAEKATEYESVGLIIGLDMAQCACCGNWIIEIDGEQNPHQFSELPENSGIDINNAVFPISVSLNWIEFKGTCKYAVISEITLN